MTDWTWADVQAEIHMTHVAEINRFRWIMGEPMIGPFDVFNPREMVDNAIETAWRLIFEGRVFKGE